MVNLSVVIPVHNEKENLKKLIADLEVSLSPIPHEIIVVDDGSTDGGCQLLRDHSPSLHLVTHSQKRGQTAALHSGAKTASGPVIATIDGDNQFSTDDIIKLYMAYQKGYELVTGWRKKRKDSQKSKVIPSFLANILIRGILGTKVKDVGCPLRVISRELFLKLDGKSGMHRYIPVLSELRGARILEVPVEHFDRTLGTTKYGLERIFPVLRDVFYIYFKYGRIVRS